MSISRRKPRLRRKKDQGKNEVKKAVREVIDEMTVAYANGAVTFSDKLTTSLAGVVDSFDNFFTRNLIDDRPQAAILFIDARLRSVREVEKLVKGKIGELRELRAKAVKLKGKPRNPR